MADLFSSPNGASIPLATRPATGAPPLDLVAEGLRLRELPGVAKLRLQALRPDLAQIESRFAGELPLRVGETRDEEPRLVCRAPGDWLAVSQERSPAQLEADLRARFASPSLLFADVSSAWTLFELSGPRGFELLLRELTIDPDGGALAPGRAVDTGFAGLTVLLVRPANEECLHLFVDRTAARWLAELLIDSAERLAPRAEGSDER